jgi:hypothetical protein
VQTVFVDGGEDFPFAVRGSGGNVFGMGCSRDMCILIASIPRQILRRRLKPAAFGLFALFALIALAGARAAFAQDAATSGDATVSDDPGVPGDSAVSTDASINAATPADSAGPGDAVAAGSDSSGDWARANPDLSTDSAEKVLEIPQTECVENGVSIPCDERITVSNAPGTGIANDNQQDNQDVNGAPASSGDGSAPASPQTFDDDTASAAPAGSDADWGTADDYANQTPIYGIPYGAVNYGGVASRGPIYGNPQIPPSMAFPFPPRPMSSPLTQAARPPLHPGPWMTSPSMMMMLSRPAGSPMASRPLRFH